MNDENRIVEAGAISDKIPVAPLSAPHRLDTYLMNGYQPDGKHSFGMDRARTAQILRETADRIESREYLLQSASILTRAEKDDYQMTYLTLEFHQKRVE